MTNEISYAIDKESLMAFLEDKGGGEIVGRIFVQCREASQHVMFSAYSLASLYAEVAQKVPSVLVELASLIDQLPLSVQDFTQDDALLSSKILRDNPHLTPEESVTLALTASFPSILITKSAPLANLTESILAE